MLNKRIDTTANMQLMLTYLGVNTFSFLTVLCFAVLEITKYVLQVTSLPIKKVIHVNARNSRMVNRKLVMGISYENY